MREIKFRGKRISDGEWLSGDLVTVVNGDLTVKKSFIHLRLSGVGFTQDSLAAQLCLHEVDPETVGQYTGLKDRNGKEIYEGDILDHYATFGYVIFEDGMFTHNWSAKVNFGHRQPLCYLDTTQCEVIGNIYENPNLLEG